MKKIVPSRRGTQSQKLITELLRVRESLCALHLGGLLYDDHHN